MLHRPYGNTIRLLAQPRRIYPRALERSQCRNFVSIGGPVADLFTTVHEVSGIPWVVLVPLTTLTLRSVFTLPLSVVQRKRIIKQQELRKVVQSATPIVKLRLAHAVQTANNGEVPGTKSSTGEEAAAAMVENSKLSNITPEQITLLAVRETRKRQKKLFKRYGIQMWKNAILPFVQIPLWVSVSLGIRNLTELQVERATKQWFDQFSWHDIDLTGPLLDYPVAIPMILGSLALLNIEYNGKMISRKSTDSVGIKAFDDHYSRTNQIFKSILNVSRIGCIFMMGVSSQAPVLLSLYWISSQAFSLLQNMVLDSFWPYKR
ncbi:membrane insertase COX18 KNAG_0D04150 [Huiozyma naganishii CBS 8797]|uniref:Uncharacterized protein n=1 Tax=Huiozyma naganishii (strain ATCC MYA-139 / BCRC 22969 / CBS 8797 / KCTC 17520 / NBRC 10181 / NCYC 3082 / Yp74L-3) TaxID=1071383 RepID=J7S779_HUIN7|nr:hypothetical protein KNAG_0D04150 [Kazachstania naganishii CBS 8797]CCK70161.1 hypothetical protein KNAG_0D04150 [Kazachstania naganishii CBS 8797]